MGSIRTNELLESLSRAVRAVYDEVRKKNPHRFVSGPIIFAENVADMLGCSVDFVHRIPRNQLPGVRIGKPVVYLREDVENYARNRIRGDNTLQPVARASRQPIGECLTFDPVAEVRGVAPRPKRARNVR